jgi:hypothetical protein
MAKAKKMRAGKYDTRLAINGTFSDVIKVSFQPMLKKEEMQKKNNKSNKK